MGGTTDHNMFSCFARLYRKERNNDGYIAIKKTQLW